MGAACTGMCLDEGGCEPAASDAAVTAAGFAHMSSPCAAVSEEAAAAAAGAGVGGGGGLLRMRLARISFLLLSLLLATGAFSVDASRECC